MSFYEKRFLQPVHDCILNELSEAGVAGVGLTMRDSWQAGPQPTQHADYARRREVADRAVTIVHPPQQLHKGRRDPPLFCMLYRIRLSAWVYALVQGVGKATGDACIVTVADRRFGESLTDIILHAAQVLRFLAQ